ncbi:hypothetical protein HYPBUDRAFT_152650 [Hyphopichia burtonii NRRL Y-1933]|uniref:Uncharacterized protein n=1 Tax=Hyphopichia burtonii NRRL Y-1933 TaxID=984485 RepID=A0A1E4RKW2_9ASCO|nr:hypothetical protein HYPBUDRAFT_152650 [Hyphopichia burtonii NRRL Y-1933]ODV67918.1 hypothetical protein HYPBUDRAFT_152650 [Hyphopichia burtonii NRRL Y-1933]
MEDFLSKDSEVFQYNYGRVNGICPERVSSFSSSFPKKSTNLDTDHHHLSFDMEILTRWIPRDFLKMLVPILYFQDIQKKNFEKKADTLSAKAVPTAQELNLCHKLRGHGYWKRNGFWYCTTKDLDLNYRDEYGPKFFSSYNSFVAWESQIQSKIYEAKLEENWDMVLKLRQAKKSVS